MKLRCSKVLITGGGSGIGKAIAKRFIDAGASVVIAGRSEEKLKQAKDEISSDKLQYIVWDITDISSFDDNIQKVCGMMKGLDGFVNSAALGTGAFTGRGYEPWDITEDEWDSLNDINYKAAFFMMRNEIDYLKNSGIKGNILNIASNAACMDIIGSYGAAKTAVIKWTRAFGKRFGSDGIIINGIAPGATFTPMISSYAHDINQPYERHAIGRFIRPVEIAELAYYLMSDYGEIVCGHTVVADGGDKHATI